MKRDLKALIGQMTLEEKASLCSGSDFWHTQGIERLGIPAVMVTDGPHGLRKQAGEADQLGLNDSVEAVCFPAGCATGSSFDPDLLEHMGQVLGDECQAEDVSILLGPAVNIKRSPLCGRNFEYISEDPYLAGILSENALHQPNFTELRTKLQVVSGRRTAPDLFPVFGAYRPFLPAVFSVAPCTGFRPRRRILRRRMLSCSSWDNFHVFYC